MCGGTGELPGTERRAGQWGGTLPPDSLPHLREIRGFCRGFLITITLLSIIDTNPALALIAFFTAPKEIQKIRFKQTDAPGPITGAAQGRGWG